MRRRDTLRLLAGGAIAGTALPRVATAHPTPSETDTDGTPAPTRTDDGYGPLGQVEVSDATEAVVSPDGSTAYVAATTGYAIVDISRPAEPTVLAERRDLQADHEDGPLEGIHDVKQDGDTLLVVGPANGRRGEYLSGALVVDVSNPRAPEHGPFYETEYPIHNCDLVGDRAFLTANSSAGIALDVIDVGTDSPARLGSWALTEYDETWAEVPHPLRVLHDVWVQDEVAYLAHWDAGTWLLDVSDPTAPTVRAHLGERSAEQVLADAEGRPRSEQFSLPGNAHFATVDDDADLLAVGREAWASAGAPPGDGTATAPTDTDEQSGTATTDGTRSVGGGPGGIDLFDISDPTAPEKVASIDPPPTVDPTISGLWTTAHNCELRDGVLYSSWYRGGVKRHDVADPANPVERTWWADPPHAEAWTARVGIAGETFVASSRGTENTPAGLYVFPDESGTRTWGFDERVGQAPSATPTGTQSPTPTATQVPTSTPANQTSAVDAPGLGVLTTLAALGLGALGRHRRGSGRAAEPDE